jgi:hypothetical protein
VVGVTGVHRQVPTDLLERICLRCVGELGVGHAAVAIATTDGLWTPAFASTKTAADLELLAFTLGEGPWCDTVHEHAPVLVGDLTLEHNSARWPSWTPAALAVGIRSISAFPIQAGAISLGALTLLSDTVGTLSGARLALALRLADAALLGLLGVAPGMDGPNADGMSDLDAIVRADVHQAAGMIMVQAGVPIDEALAQLRARAYSIGRPLSELAAEVIARSVRFDTDDLSAQ